MKDNKRRLQIQNALREVNAKYGRALKSLTGESAELDPSAEKAMDEEELSEDLKQLPEYDSGDSSDSSS